MNEPVGPSEIQPVMDSTRGELAEYTGLEPTSAGADSAAIERIESDLDEALEAYEANNSSEAKAIIKETYLTNFEGLEGTLIQERPELVEDLEEDFNENLPGLIDEDASPEEVREQIDDMKADLETAEEILASQSEETISLDVSNSTTTDSTPGTTTESTTTTTSTPGFGFAVGLVAVVIALVARRSMQ